jgi:hypothetical protein
MSTSSLLSLPFELRQHIFGFALKEVGTIELTHPLWAVPQAFSQPLFLTSKEVRDEALEAFYKTNAFLWIIDDEEWRSNPADYARAHSHDRDSSMITPALPWDYPHLLQHLRHLHVNICLPKEENEKAWHNHLQSSLSSLVEALDGGRRLRSVAILFTSRRINTLLHPLSSQHLHVLNTLSQMEVPGMVKMRTRYDFQQVKASIESLGLEKAMKSASTKTTTSDDSQTPWNV